MRRSGFIALTAAALSLVLFFALHSPAKMKIKIGVLHSLTGTMAGSEKPLVDAVRLAVEEVNQAGGVNGSQIEMIVVDCRSDAAYCARQAQMLITQDQVKALFGCWTSACRKAVKPVVEKHHQLLFYPVQYEGLEASPDIIYLGATPNQQVTPMVSWALQHRGPRAYLIGSDYIFPRTANMIVKKLLPVQGGQLLAERYVPLGEQNLDAIVREIAALHPDFVLNTLNGDSNVQFFTALRRAGISAKDIPVFSTSIAEVELAAMGPELMSGNYAAWNYFQSVPTEENQAFIKHFQQRFGAERVLDDPMETAYIGVKLWANAVNRAKTWDMQTVKASLAQQTINAPEGIIAVDGSTHHLWKPVRIGRALPSGQFQIIWQSERNMAPAPFPFFIPRSELAATIP